MSNVRHFRLTAVIVCLICSIGLSVGISHTFAQEDGLSSSYDCVGDCGNRCVRGALFRWPGAEEPGPARPDRIISDEPHIADSAAVVGLGTFQLEQNNVYTRDASAGPVVETYTPAFLLRVGMICDWFEFRLGWSYNEEYTFDPTVGGMNRDGADDLYIGSKLALAEQHGILPELAVFPQMTVPTGADRYSADEVLPGVVFSYGWEITEKVGLEVNTSFDRARDDANAFYTETLQVVNLEVGLSDNVVLFNEMVGIWPHAARVAQTEYFYHGGLQYFPTDDLVLYVHAAVGLNGAADNFFGGLGFSIRTPK